MINLSGIETKWQRLQDQMIQHHNNVVFVYFHTTYSGTSTSFDDYLNEGLDANQPTSFSGITSTQTSPVSITGIAYPDYSSLGAAGINHMQIGWFEKSSMLFVCRITDATVNGKNIFLGCQKVKLDDEYYVVSKIIKSGLGTNYIYNILLDKSNIGA